MKQYDRDIKKFGYRSKITLRSDGEPAIRDLLDKVAAMRASETVTEHTPKGDSRANGCAEREGSPVDREADPGAKVRRGGALGGLQCASSGLSVACDTRR